MLDKDAFDIIRSACEKADGSWDFEVLAQCSQKFKETFLERGGSEEPMVLYKTFAGREPDSKAMLRARGL